MPSRAHTCTPPSLTAPHVSLTASQLHHSFAHPHTHPLAHTLSTCIAHTRHSIASQVGDRGSGFEADSAPAESAEAAAPEAAAVRSAAHPNAVLAFTALANPFTHAHTVSTQTLYPHPRPYFTRRSTTT
jgi:hypothetical protein